MSQVVGGQGGEQRATEVTHMKFRAQNVQLSHKVLKPCIRCHRGTEALDPRTGQIMPHPICPRCKSFLTPKPKATPRAEA